MSRPDACCRHLEGGMFTWDRTSVLGCRTDRRGGFQIFGVILCTAFFYGPRCEFAFRFLPVKWCVLTKVLVLPNILFNHLCKSSCLHPQHLSHLSSVSQLKNHLLSFWISRFELILVLLWSQYRVCTSRMVWIVKWKWGCFLLMLFRAS